MKLVKTIETHYDGLIEIHEVTAPKITTHYEVVHLGSFSRQYRVIATSLELARSTVKRLYDWQNLTQSAFAEYMTSEELRALAIIIK